MLCASVVTPMAINGAVSTITFGLYNPAGSAIAGIAVGRHGNKYKDGISDSTTPVEPESQLTLHHGASCPLQYEEASKHGTDTPVQFTNYSVELFDPNSVLQQILQDCTEK
jgi:hypothetical protein